MCMPVDESTDLKALIVELKGRYAAAFRMPVCVPLTGVVGAVGGDPSPDFGASQDPAFVAFVLLNVVE